MTGQQDRVLLLIGFAGALRRSELVAVHREHLTFTAEGMRLLIPRAKSDKEGRGAEIGIPRGMKPETCPVRAMEFWLRASDCQYGPVFRKVNQWDGIETTALQLGALPKILARRVALAGLKANAMERLSAHGPGRDSLRRPTRPGRGTRRSWITTATRMSGPCAGMSGGRSWSAKARRSWWSFSSDAAARSRLGCRYAGPD
ncbi:hypothetical protein E2C06_33670 [Dankookia rubra]|uniref:Tyr recombinase domain-containing protein n=1 Tax=Dankookia rubra TaxID=1442381 RepID=A0A4R5Q6V8_9PROT|nr:hypothetical protein [Dankookia rubra]TDH58239.1 hypothetical protein E2C06_33670 [Dankookia rubra]